MPYMNDRMEINMFGKGTVAYSNSNSKRKNRPIVRFRFKAVFLIIFASFLMCFAVYMTEANINSKKLNSAGFSADSSALSSAAANDVKNVKKEEKSIINPVPAGEPLTETYFGKCAFVGDSISVGLADYQLVPMKNVFAELGMNIEKINTEAFRTPYGNITAIEALKRAKPENVYIMLGSNGIAWLTIQDMIDYYSKFVDNIKKDLPDTRIYILSVPPVTAERETAAEQPILNSDLDKYNSELLKMANEKQLYYVDINTALKGNDGKFPSDMAETDGMHFKKSTYSVMLDYILSHTVK